MNIVKYSYDADNDALARKRGQWRDHESNGLSARLMIEAGLDSLKKRHAVKEKFHEIAVERGVLNEWKKMEVTTPAFIRKLFQVSPFSWSAHHDMVKHYQGDEITMCFDISYLAATMGVSIEEGAVMLARAVCCSESAF